MTRGAVRTSIFLAAVAAAAGCARKSAAPPDGSPMMAAASGVSRADGGKGPRDDRIVPIHAMADDVEILYGNPEAEGEPFVMRVRELPGAIVPPHSHPVDENITVVQGTWYFAVGPEFDRGALRKLEAGGYAFAPKGSTMFGFSPDGAIVQIHGVGPFRIHWHGGLRTLNDADARTTFRFARGERIVSPRGEGTIVEGYGSGRIIQYEVEGSGGGRFMVSEEDARRP
jgi:quercetin dioxygenase-like cupin family protein